MSAILDLPLSSVIELILYGYEQEKEKAAWELWKSIFPFMQMGWIEFMEFSSFKNNLFKPNYRYTNKSKAEIEDEMMKVVAAYEGR